MTKSKLFSLALLLAIIGVVRFAAPKTCLAADCQPKALQAQIAPHYYWYSQAQLEQALDRHDRVVLFFFAPWCGSCSVLDSELQAHPERLASGITILKIAYDTDRAMDQRYNVVTQHTLVQIDGSGNAIRSWVGGDIATLNTMVQ